MHQELELGGSVHTVAKQTTTKKKKQPVEWLHESSSNHSAGFRVSGGSASMSRHQVISVQQLP